MSSQFGSPKKGDGAANLERATEHATKRAKEMFTLVQDRYQRPPGTVPVKAPDRKFDYDNRGPDYWPKMFLEAVKSAPPGSNKYEILEQLLLHDKEMRGG